MKKVIIISENSEYQYSKYKVGEIYTISYDFDELYIATKDNSYAPHSIGVKKTDCEIIMDT